MEKASYLPVCMHSSKSIMKQSANSENVEGTGYFKATREDLLRTLNDPSRVKTQVDIVAPLKVERMLDIGCGIGQALLPLAVSKNAFGIGVDISNAALRMGREFYTTHIPSAKVAFLQSKAESLPFESDSFDVVNCGLALPYTDNAHAIAEVARVLRPGGLFLLKIHHTRYYLREFWRGITSRDISSIIHGGRVLVAGTIYHLVRRQPHARFLNETFQTKWLLSRELAKHGLTIEREQLNSNPLTPAYIIHKAA
jgi:ubiquinone/menaquinone biosynthesis C-methylase UbiE